MARRYVDKVWQLRLTPTTEAMSLAYFVVNNSSAAVLELVAQGRMSPFFYLTRCGTTLLGLHPI